MSVGVACFKTRRLASTQQFLTPIRYQHDFAKQDVYKLF
jgi:hypothetical protein